MLGKDGDTATNGGVNLDYVYEFEYEFGNSTDELYIYNSIDFIDIVIWDNGATFPDPNGASISLNPRNQIVQTMTMEQTGAKQPPLMVLAILAHQGQKMTLAPPQRLMLSMSNPYWDRAWAATEVSSFHPTPR